MQALSTRSVVGAIMLVLGVGFLFDALGIINFSSILGTWWPLAIILVGLIKLLNPADNRIISFVIILFGLVLQARTLGTLSFNLWALFWPTVLILAGVSLLLQSRGIRATAERVIDLAAYFGGVEKKLKTQGFEGGTVTIVFGGGELDLRDVSFAENCTLNVFVAFGGLTINVPSSCLVVSSGTPILGGFEDRTKLSTDKDKAERLTIVYTALFGGVEVAN